MQAYFSNKSCNKTTIFEYVFKMADTEGRVSECSEESKENSDFADVIKYACCIKKSCSVCVCVKCFGFYHLSCASRKTMKFVSSNRVMCNQCQQDLCQNSASGGILSSQELGAKVSIENSLLRELINEVNDKNQVLKQNANLLQDKIKFLEEKIRNLEKNRQQIINSKLQQSDQINLSKNVNKTSCSNICSMVESNHSTEAANLNFNNKTLEIKGRTTSSKEIETRGIKYASMGPAAVNKIAESDVAAGIQQALSANKMKEIINLDKGDKEADGQWKVVEKRKRIRRLSLENRPAPIRGTNRNFNLSVARRMIWLFLSGLSPEITDIQVKEFIKDKVRPTHDIVCEKMTTRKDKYRSCFKIGIEYEVQDKVMDPELWGTGVSINHFMNLRRSPQTETDRMN